MSRIVDTTWMPGIVLNSTVAVESRRVRSDSRTFRCRQTAASHLFSSSLQVSKIQTKSETETTINAQSKVNALNKNLIKHLQKVFSNRIREFKIRWALNLWANFIYRLKWACPWSSNTEMHTPRHNAYLFDLFLFIESGSVKIFRTSDQRSNSAQLVW